MKSLLIFSLCFFLISCNKNKTEIKKPSFLIGNWKRLNDKPGSQTYENWNADYTGMGYTKKETKTTFKETLSIVSINDTLHLKVEGVNEKPTLFKFTNQTDTSFVCENPKNEFPKKITYFKDGKQLKAIVAADDFRIDFLFEKGN
ncbi:DUF6265 family protein [Polaribacter porphyrae]|uniref:DUF6265 domain-containing protein n=1 Tax=Polaribacter porphyrae TaxID=1137780 RepID=A0A2S7WSK9_9FLAO|nr:DUF6265 family protein [Polaribacter porphyrae]PQJ80579.1 hypothetical protein BTO18_15955 [Polaribacter porphyrae]